MAYNTIFFSQGMDFRSARRHRKEMGHYLIKLFVSFYAFFINTFPEKPSLLLTNLAFPTK